MKTLRDRLDEAGTAETWTWHKLRAVGTLDTEFWDAFFEKRVFTPEEDRVIWTLFRPDALAHAQLHYLLRKMDRKLDVLLVRTGGAL